MKDHLIDYLPPRIILGRQTETGVNAVRIDCQAWLGKWPELELSVWVTPPGGNAAYPAVTHMEGTVLVWPITSSDTAHEGFGSAEIMGTAAGLKKLSAIAETLIQHTSIEATSDPPTPAQPWVDAVMNAAKRAEEAADRAESAGGSGSGGPGGITQESDPTVPAWAKEPTKPTYTAEEVGARPADWLPTPEDIGAASTEDVERLSEEIGEKQPKGDYALRSEIPEPYTLPTASAEVKGGVKVGEGLQMDGDVLNVQDKVYTHIETFTFGEDMAFERTQEPSGRAYAFDAIAIQINKPADMTIGFAISIKAKFTGGRIEQPCYFVPCSKTDNLWMLATVENYKGLARRTRTTDWAVYNSTSAVNEVPFLMFDNVLRKGDVIVSISTSQIIPAGITFKIWGVRANA